MRNAFGEKPASPSRESRRRTEEKSKEMPIDGEMINLGYHEASRAVLALSIPTPRQPQLERETTADAGNTHLKRAESRRSEEQVETLDANLVWSSLVYAPRQAVRQKR